MGLIYLGGPGLGIAVVATVTVIVTDTSNFKPS